jgi:predicted Zn-dependent protease
MWRRRAAALTLGLCCLGTSGAAGQEEADPATDSGPFLFAAARMLAGESGRTDEALELFERAVAIDPDAPFLRIGLADFLIQLERLEDAAEHLAVAYRNAPRDVDVLRRYGRIQMQLSDRARDREAVDRALEALEALRELAPSDITGMLLLSQIRAALGERKEAAAVLEELVSYHNGNRQLQRMLAGALREAGENERARQVEADILRFDERSAEERSVEERLELAGRESRQGNHTRAIEMLEGLAAELSDSIPVQGALAEEYYRRAMSPGRTPDQRAEDLAEALRRLRELPRAARRNRGARVLEARILSASGRGPEAIELLEGLRREQPDDLQLLRELIGRLMEEGEWERIRQIGRNLVDSADRGTVPGRDSADFGLGLLVEALRQLGKIDQALAELESETERRGESVELLLSQAELLAESGRKRRAMAILRRDSVATERLLSSGGAGEPDVQAILRKAGIYVDLDEARQAARTLDRFAAAGDVRQLVGIADFWRMRGRFAESAPLIELALVRMRSGAETGFDLDPETLRAGLFFQLGEAYERTRRYDEAAEQFQAVLAIQPENSTAMNYLGYMWADNGENLEQALELVRRAVALEPNNGAYVDSLGWALFRLGEFEEARRHLERANQLAPEDPTILEHLGDVYVALGDTRRAREAYEHALAIDDEENVEAVRRKLGELSRR